MCASLVAWCGIVAGQPGNDGFWCGAGGWLLLHQGGISRSSHRAIGGDPQLAQATLDVCGAGRCHRSCGRPWYHGDQRLHDHLPTPPIRMFDQAALGAAIRYAAVDKKDAVIVAAETPERADRSSASRDFNPLTGHRPPQTIRELGASPRCPSVVVAQPYDVVSGVLSIAGSHRNSACPRAVVGIAAGKQHRVGEYAGRRRLANRLPTPTRNWWLSGGTSYAARLRGWPRAGPHNQHYPRLNATGWCAG